MNKKNVLFISPHTDDVELGAGGTLIKFMRAGYNILWVVFSTAEDAVPLNMSKNILKNEFLEVVNDLKLDENNYKIFNYKVRNLHLHRQEILDSLIKIRRQFSPDIVVGPSLHDFHQDHQVVANEMVRAFKTTSSIISYELPWNHVEFSSQFFVKLSSEIIDKKISLLKNYKSQIHMKRKYFSPEFIKGWARMRGIQINAEFAEAFEVIRWTI